MISPYSVINALAMTANGASGETLEQMESVLCGTSDCSLDLLNRELQRLQSSMPKEKIIIYIQRILSGTKILMRTLYRQMIF